MNYDELKQMIDAGRSQREIAELTGKSHTSVRYWLDKHNLSTDFHGHRRVELGEGLRECPKCITIKPLSDFHVRKGGKPTSYCKACNTQNVLDRQVQFKLDCLDYKGGRKCSCCGYDKSYVALEFHHENPAEKEFAISKYKMYKFNDEVKAELDKCIVVCSNCHKEIHHTLSKGR